MKKGGQKLLEQKQSCLFTQPWRLFTMKIQYKAMSKLGNPVFRLCLFTMFCRFLTWPGGGLTLNGLDAFFLFFIEQFPYKIVLATSGELGKAGALTAPC